MQKILIVDDSKTIRAVAEMALRRLNYEVFLAEDGFEALSIIQKDRPALVFLDIIMPKIDGYKLCTMIKSNPQYKEIPVVILSSKDSVFDKAKGKLSGCDAYLVKPFEESDLVNIISSLLDSEPKDK